MIIVKRDEFKKLLEKNPGKKFAFYEYTPCTFVSELHITMGEEINPSFGAYAVDAPGPFDEVESDILGDPYDWNINEYSHKDLFAVLEPADLNSLANMLIEASKDYLKSDVSSINPKTEQEQKPEEILSLIFSGGGGGDCEYYYECPHCKKLYGSYGYILPKGIRKGDIFECEKCHKKIRY